MSKQKTDDATESVGATAPAAKPLPTVDELAKLTGNVLEFKNPNLPETMPNARHAAAAALHGWNDHAYHAGEPMRLSEADYLAALKAAESTPDGEQSFRPHAKAVSRHCGHAFGRAR